MKILILQHEIDTPAGTALEWLRQQGIEFTVLRVDQQSSLSDYPSPDSIDGLIICGGSMNVDQEDRYTWLRTEKIFLRQVLERQKKVLGLCLGGQLIAEALGAPVRSLGRWESGWFNVSWAGQSIPAFHWHLYGFGLPPGAELVAFNDQTPHQAFSYGKNVLAFQFHPEVDQEWIDLALLDLSDDWSKNETGLVQSPTQIREESPRYLIGAKLWFFSKLEEFF